MICRLPSLSHHSTAQHQSWCTSSHELPQHATACMVHAVRLYLTIPPCYKYSMQTHSSSRSQLQTGSASSPMRWPVTCDRLPCGHHGMQAHLCRVGKLTAPGSRQEWRGCCGSAWLAGSVDPAITSTSIAPASCVSAMSISLHQSTAAYSCQPSPASSS